MQRCAGGSPAPVGERDRRQRACAAGVLTSGRPRSEEHTSELQSLTNLVCRLLLEKKNNYARQARLTTIFAARAAGHRGSPGDDPHLLAAARGAGADELVIPCAANESASSMNARYT